MMDTMGNDRNETKTTETAPEAAAFAEELDAANASLDPPANEAPAETQAISVEETLQQELDTAKDRILRISAELDNYRKRVQREVQEERRYAAMPLMRELLPVVDNLKRTIEAAQKVSEGADGLLEGVTMVLQQFESVLAKHGCVKIDAAGQPFDPNLHDAILQQPSDDVAPNTVLFETQTGYRLHERVVRPSQVIVSKKSE